LTEIEQFAVKLLMIYHISLALCHSYAVTLSFDSLNLNICCRQGHCQL